MNASLAKALAALERLDADPAVDGAADMIEEAHRDIARGLGLTVFPPSNHPYTTVSDRPDADPYCVDDPYSGDRQQVWAMPAYSEDFVAATTLAPAGFSLVLVQERDRWKAAYRPVGGTEPDPSSWRGSRHPFRAIAMAALAARLGPTPG